MPKLYCDANPSYIAYVLDGGGFGVQSLWGERSSMEAEYMAISFGLNEYFLKWQRELDERQYDGLDEELTKSSSIAAHTKRPLPPPVLVCCDNEVVVKQLSRQCHIANVSLRKLAETIWKQCQNVEVKFEWVSRKENLAGKMLP